MVTKVQLAVKEEQSRQIPPSALQLAYTDRDGRLQLDESVVQRCFLDAEVSEYSLCLICVIGETRRGKSTLLNYIMRALHCLERHQPVSLGQDEEPLSGFEWRNDTDGVTKGIWIWSKPFILERNEEKMAVYVLDTEGSLDIEGDPETCLKLSALSMLLSSYLIFNVNACLKTTELDYLGMYLHVSELTGESFSLQHLQHLDVLVRDWQDPDNCGREAARTYLQKKSEKLREQKSSEYQRVLDTLRSSSVSGFLFPHPGKRFLRASQGTLSDMDEDFRNHLTRYISELMAGIWFHQKTDTSGEKITSGHVGRVLKEFVIMLQKRSFCFTSPLQMFYEFENWKHMNSVLESFQDFLDQQLPANASPFRVLWVTPSEMMTRVSEQTDVHLDKYEGILSRYNTAKKEMHMEEMKSQLKEKQESFCAEYSKRFTKCAVGIGCVVGGGVLSLAGGAIGAAVAETVLAVEAFGGAIALGAIGTGVGAGVGHVIGNVEKEKVTKAERSTETSKEDTHHLVDKKD
ncbi:unnamed protein product [Staurois parvus]|uniref:GB1/RHD3-type G domain-containing protein n=1 Tax=Staurois parvus TaxID=386267 RepID=A0ABN9D355_9NEOB|nr:unnamed protein product [Staurois parvus]